MASFTIDAILAVSLLMIFLIWITAMPIKSFNSSEHIFANDVLISMDKLGILKTLNITQINSVLNSSIDNSKYYLIIDEYDADTLAKIGNESCGYELESDNDIDMAERWFYLRNGTEISRFYDAKLYLWR